MHKEIVLKNSGLARSVEVVMPSEDLIARIVNERIAELLSEAQTSDLQPFFERPEVAEVMRRTQAVIERKKWLWYLEAFGCLICERKDRPHAGLGMCPSCLGRTRERLRAVKRERAPDVAKQEFRDSVRLAREAVLPSIENLARKRGDK